MSLSDVSCGSAAAVLLSLVAAGDAAALVSALVPSEVQALCAAMESLSNISEEQVDSVLADFIVRARAAPPLADKTQRALRSVIEESLGPSRTLSILSRSGPDRTHPVFDEIQWLSSGELLELIEQEPPQVAAVAIALLDPGLAASVIEGLDDVVRADILARLATLKPLETDALDDLQWAIAALQAVPAKPPIEVGGPAPVAALLNRLDRGKANRTLKLLARHDKTMANAIDDRRVTFADVLDLSDKDLGVVVRTCDAKMLARAMKGLDDAAGDRLFAVMSARAADTLRDEMAELASISREDTEAAQTAMVATARRLSDEDVITIGGRRADG